MSLKKIQKKEKERKSKTLENSFKSKILHLKNQDALQNKGEIVTSKNLSVHDLNIKLGHYHAYSRVEALMGMKELINTFINDLNFCNTYLTRIVENCLSKLFDEDSSVRNGLFDVIKTLLTSSLQNNSVFMPLVPLISTVVLSGLSHLRVGVRQSSLQIFRFLLQQATFDLFNKDSNLIELGNSSQTMFRSSFVNMDSIPFLNIFHKDVYDNYLTVFTSNLFNSSNGNKTLPLASFSPQSPSSPSMVLISLIGILSPALSSSLTPLPPTPSPLSIPLTFQDAAMYLSSPTFFNLVLTPLSSLVVEGSQPGKKLGDKTNTHGGGGEGSGDGKKKKKHLKPKPMEKRLRNAEKDTEMKLRAIATLQASISSSSVASAPLTMSHLSDSLNPSKGDSMVKGKGREKEGDILLDARKPVVDCITLIMERLLLGGGSVSGGMLRRSGGGAGKSRKGEKMKNVKSEKPKSGVDEDNNTTTFDLFTKTLNDHREILNIAHSSSVSSLTHFDLEKPCVSFSPALLLRLVQLFVNLMNEVNLLFVNTCWWINFTNSGCLFELLFLLLVFLFCRF
jgi:hypothetical protein